MFDQKDRYVIEDYSEKPVFSSFLPGIAGPMGVPVWCYYNNRGQAVCSFGAKDKDHAVMEFAPAYCAYRDVSRRGFRTFCKINGAYQELFTGRRDMHIAPGELEICEKSGDLEVSAVYFGLPEERAAALVRALTVRNASDRVLELELLDGMPELVTYGIDQDILKNMTQLATAWMRAEDAEQGLACFRTRASIADTAQVTEVRGCNFGLGWDESGALLHPIVEQRLVFGEDVSFAAPENFIRSSLDAICAAGQMTENAFPCCFLPKKATLAPGREIKLYALYGQADCKEEVRKLAAKVTGAPWFEEKRQAAARLMEELTSAVCTKTADPVFDGYCRQTYLDNLMRGGVPYFFEDGGKKTPFYLYSRKHGDPEREYNYFSLGGEYFAQGNGNFRDVNQNRRCDVFFSPAIGDANIRLFYELIQPDGYNPLVLTAAAYTFSDGAPAKILSRIPASAKEAAERLFAKPFTPGALAMAAEDWGMDKDAALELTAMAVCAAENEPNADFSEGYWCDHWTYNLDLVENYLNIYPEREQELLFEGAGLRWYAPHVFVNPRTKRYEMTENGLRQYHALTEAAPAHKWICTEDGREARSTLIEKMLLLCCIKTATLDAAGLGIEMEGGKPGWYDALNGLPGLLGSSMAETCELLRLVRFVSAALQKRKGEVGLYREIAELLEAVAGALCAPGDAYARWDNLNTIKEKYRADTKAGFNGQRMQLDTEKARECLRVMETVLADGIQAARMDGNGILPTYYIFEAGKVTPADGGLMPEELTPHALPLFLEGPVHWMKLPAPLNEKRAMAKQIRESGLYDKELGMYKVNESLKDVSYEAGRAKAFSAGWLENESIWLHMEYKYLLELLRSGLYEEFADAFHTAAVPFFDPGRYGRSPLENVSFLASGANPDPSRWGRGYVARLSGSTAEFLEMWQILFFGRHPFYADADGLHLSFSPFLPDYLIPADAKLCTTFLGSIPVTYQIGDRQRGGCFSVKQWTLTFADGRERTIESSVLGDAEARAVRDGQVTAMHLILK